MHTVGIIQARMGSTRLPGKILAPICNQWPLLSFLVKRVANPQIEWWLATSDNPLDDITAAWGAELGLNVYRGNEENVLSRFVDIAKVTGCEWMVRVTADDPFMEWETISELMKRAISLPDDIDIICSNSSNRQFRIGYVPEIFRSSAIRRIQNQIPPDLFYHRSNVTSFLIPDRADFFSDNSLPSRAKWRWTVDTREDLEMAQATFSGMGNDSFLSTYRDIVEFLDRNPDIVNLNLGIRQKSIVEG